jgi:hypothetical protein
MHIKMVIKNKSGGTVLALHTSRWAMIFVKVLYHLQIEK